MTILAERNINDRLCQAAQSGEWEFVRDNISRKEVTNHSGIAISALKGKEHGLFMSIPNYVPDWTSVLEYASHCDEETQKIVARAIHSLPY